MPIHNNNNTFKNGYSISYITEQLKSTNNKWVKSGNGNTGLYDINNHEFKIINSKK